MNTADSPKPSGVRRFRRWIVVAFGLALVYVLSIGPAVQMNKRGWITVGTIEKIYFPLVTTDFFPGYSSLLDKYMRLWADPERRN